uniref:Uncharacterized protein n=1 Tax=Arundo donax TaxID=35708 RepID=A0A0A8Z438_ARUDO
MLHQQDILVVIHIVQNIANMIDLFLILPCGCCY